MQSESEVRAYPFQEGIMRLGVSKVKGHALVKNGELQTFTIGSRRYVTEVELQRFIDARIAASMNETAASRARKVQGAVDARKNKRDAIAA